MKPNCLSSFLLLIAGSQIGGGGGTSQVFVRCSDPNVICDSRVTQAGEPHDVFIKVCESVAILKRFYKGMRVS